MMRCLRRIGTAALFVLFFCSPRTHAHDVPGIPDFSDSMLFFRTIGGTGVPGGNNGDNGIGFPIDPRDLQGGAQRAVVFHEHFRGNAPFDDTFHGTIVFTVFNGPRLSACGQRILPPQRKIYRNARGDFTVAIDFDRIMQSNTGPDDLGAFDEDDWIYGYVVINDEGDADVGRPSGNDAISGNILAFASGLRRVIADGPSGTIRGATIGAIGDIESLPGVNTTDPSQVLLVPTFGVVVAFDSVSGDGCVPDVSDANEPGDCNRGDLAPVTNMLYLTSPFGPGVANISHQGGSGATVTEENVVLGPMTYPNFGCESVRIDNLTRPGDTVILVGDEVAVVAMVSNPAPAIGPPYGFSLPGGTQRGTVGVQLRLDQGNIDLATDFVEVCLELDSRFAEVLFEGTVLDPVDLLLSTDLLLQPPYDTGPTPPFDSDDPQYVDRFPVNLADPGTCGVDLNFEDALRGNVNARIGTPVDVLFVNGETGGEDTRRLTISQIDPFDIFMSPSPSRGPGRSSFVLYVWQGGPSELTSLSFGLGVMGRRPPFEGGQPALIANNLGFEDCLGVERWPGPATLPAPSLVLFRPNGLRRIDTFFLQGFIRDTDSPTGRAAVTNGIIVEVE